MPRAGMRHLACGLQCPGNCLHHYCGYFAGCSVIAVRPKQDRTGSGLSTRKRALGGLLGCGLMLIFRISVILLPAFSAVLVSAANAQQACEIDEAQRLFGLQPRPVAAVE